MYSPNFKSVAFLVPAKIGGTRKFGQSLDTPTLPFLRNVSCFIRMDTVIVLAKFEVRSLTHSRDNSDWTFGWGANTQSWGRGGRRWSGMVPSERAKVSSYRLPILIFKRY